MKPEYENSINFGKLYSVSTQTTTEPLINKEAYETYKLSMSKSIGVAIGDCTKLLVPIKMLPSIKKVIFSKPATVVIWGDNTKTVVKCADGEEYSEEVGLAMCIAEKYCGNYSQFKKVVRKGKTYEAD